MAYFQACATCHETKRLSAFGWGVVTGANRTCTRCFDLWLASAHDAPCVDRGRVVDAIDILTEGEGVE